jgi:ribonuclease T1
MTRYASLLLLAVLVGVMLFWLHRPLTPATQFSSGPVPSGSAALRSAAPASAAQTGPNCPVSSTPLPAYLPPEACDTLTRIVDRGPFQHRQDGVVFGNYEGLLPPEPRGYYHEYTVETPGADNRGARRIIVGGNPPEVYYYTDDHYRSFRRFEMH